MSTLSPEIRKQAREHLDQFEKLISAGDAAAKEEARLREAIESLSAEIAAIGTPSFDDEKAIERMTKAKIRISLAREQADRHAESQSQHTRELVELIRVSVDLCQAVLAPAIEVLLQSVVESLSPLFSNRVQAIRVARETDIARTALHKSTTLPLVYMSLAEAIDFGVVRGFSQELVEILSAASSPEKAARLLAPRGQPQLAAR